MQDLPPRPNGGAAVDEESLAHKRPPHERRRAGAYFTPAPLVRAVLDAAAPLIPGSSPLAIVDPACGAGAFLVPARERFPGARLFGLELSEESARTCAERVPAARVLVGDALRGGWERLVAALPGDGVELWIGNPPYNGTSSILEDAERFRELQRLLPEDLPLPRGTSLRDDYAFFLLLAAQRVAARGGALAFVTSATLIDAFLYAPVRQALLRALHPAEVIELGAGVFAGTKVRTCVTVWSSAAAGKARYRKRAEEADGFEPAQLGSPVPLEPEGPDWLLRPPPRSAEALDWSWRALGEPISTLVPVSLPGLKTRFDELLVDEDPDRLLSRVTEFLALDGRDLASFASRHGIPNRLLPKLALLKASVGEEVAPSPGCVRRFFRYAGARHRDGIPESARAWCYLDRRLIPRGDHRLHGAFDPHACPQKLVFNARELPLAATYVEDEGCIHMHRHARFAPLYVPQRIRDEGLAAAARERDLGPDVSNLSPAGLKWACKLGGPEEAFRAIARFLNSKAVQEIWAPAFGAAREPWIPLDT